MPPLTLSLSCAAPADTRRVAGAVAAFCRRGDCLLLSGDLGAGKTEFARGFIGALCAPDQSVTSPTFTLAQLYDMQGGGAVWHFDLYRLNSPAELAELGFDEALESGISLVEWPDMARPRSPAQSLEVTISHGAREQARSLSLSGDAARWESAFTALRREYAA